MVEIFDTKKFSAIFLLTIYLYKYIIIKNVFILPVWSVETCINKQEAFL